VRVDLIIDGYNLMHFAGLARERYGPGDLERARNRLLQRVRRGLSQDERSRTTIVFDGQYAPIRERSVQLFHGMEIHFSPVGLEADDVIEDLVAAHSSPKQLMVISSDNRLQIAAKRRKAGYLDSDSFLVELDEREERAKQIKQSARTESRDVQTLSDTDLAEWMNVFADLDVNAIETDVRKEEARRKAIKQAEKKKQTQQEKKASQAAKQQPSTSATTPEVEQADDDQQTQATLGAADYDFWRERIAELIQEEGLQDGEIS